MLKLFRRRARLGSFYRLSGSVCFYLLPAQSFCQGGRETSESSGLQLQQQEPLNAPPSADRLPFHDLMLR